MSRRSTTDLGYHVRGTGMPSCWASLYVLRLSHAHRTASHPQVGTRNRSRRRSRCRENAATVSSLVGNRTQPSRWSRVPTSSIMSTDRSWSRRLSTRTALVVDHAHRQAAPPEAADDPQTLVVTSNDDGADAAGAVHPAGLRAA